MKKTLLVAAMMASFTGAAVAQNSVTLYGRITPAYVFETVKLNDTASSTTGTAAGTYNQFSPQSGFISGGNNIGFKGVEDLGNGLKAAFKYEFGFNGQTGAEGGTAREAHLTLSNAAWGSVGMGYDYTATSVILSGISPVGTDFGVMSAQDAFGVFSVSAGNQIKYFSPSISGFTVGLSYSFSGTTSNVAQGTFGTSNKNRLGVVGLRYANGPIVVAGTFMQLSPNSSNTAAATKDKKPKNWVLGGTYDLKVVKLHAAYGQNIDGVVAYGQDTFDGLADPASADVNPSSGLVANIRTNQWMAGVSGKVGSAGKAFFSISQLKPGGNLTTALNAAGNKAFKTMTNFGLAYEYSLSKRTTLRASYGYATNYGMVSGLKVQEIGAGIRHTF
uniref:porin n=1 Tax=Orrella sp. TaxID=1921583 RepID=UPI0040477067